LSFISPLGIAPAVFLFIQPAVADDAERRLAAGSNS
jgi:hypothetical protein